MKNVLIERPKTVDFSGAQVGDKVTSLRYGKCVVDGLREKRIVVNALGKPLLILFSHSGLSKSDIFADLFYGHFDGWPTEENLVRPADPVTFEMDEKVMVSIDDGQNWFRQRFSHKDALGFHCFDLGQDSWVSEGKVSLWFIGRKPTAEELAS